jgi:hypothetical protein
VQTYALYLRVIEAMVPETGPGLLVSEMASALEARYSLNAPASALGGGGWKRTGRFYQAGEEGPQGYLPAAAAFNQGEAVIPTGAKRLEEWHEANLAAVRATVRDWVFQEKTLAEGESPEAAYERVEWILGLGQGQKPEDQTPAMMAAADKLAQAIQPWIDLQVERKTSRGTIEPIGSVPTSSAALAGGGGTGAAPATGRATMDRAVMAQMLGAVLAAWVAYVRRMLPMTMEHELGKLNREVKK